MTNLENESAGSENVWVLHPPSVYMKLLLSSMGHPAGATVSHTNFSLAPIGHIDAVRTTAAFIMALTYILSKKT